MIRREFASKASRRCMVQRLSHRTRSPTLRKSVLSFSHHLLNELLATGRFLTIVAGSVLKANAERWDLKALPIDLTIQPHSVAAFTLRQRTVSPVVELFIEHAREVARSIARNR